MRQIVKLKIILLAKVRGDDSLFYRHKFVVLLTAIQRFLRHVAAYLLNRYEQISRAKQFLIYLRMPLISLQMLIHSQRERILLRRSRQRLSDETLDCVVHHRDLTADSRELRHRGGIPLAYKS